MTIQELIDYLNEFKDKNKEVCLLGHYGETITINKSHFSKVQVYNKMGEEAKNALRIYPYDQNKNQTILSMGKIIDIKLEDD